MSQFADFELNGFTIFSVDGGAGFCVGNVAIRGGWRETKEEAAHYCLAANAAWEAKQSLEDAKRMNIASDKFKAAKSDDVIDRCGKCSGTGQTKWGMCFQCSGKGKMTKSDAVRSVAYWSKVA